jgi:hypothetical protein
MRDIENWIASGHLTYNEQNVGGLEMSLNARTLENLSH